MAKVYAIVSGKGGVGKTVTTINLGTSLSNLGHNVVIVDGNLLTPNIGLHLGAPIVPITLNHVLNNQAKVEEAIYEHHSGAKILPASLSLKASEKIDYKKLPEIMKRLKKISDYVLVDSAAGLGEEVRFIINSIDEAIVVTNPEISAVTDALKIIKLLEQKNKPIKGLILTRYQNKSHEMPLENIKDMLEIPLLGIIPEDVAIKQSLSQKNSVIYTHPKSKSAKGYINASKRLLGENLELEFKESGGVIKRFLRSIGLGS